MLKVINKIFDALKSINLDICAVKVVLNTEHTSLYENSMKILENHSKVFFSITM